MSLCENDRMASAFPEGILSDMPGTSNQQNPPCASDFSREESDFHTRSEAVGYVMPNIKQMSKLSERDTTF